MFKYTILALFLPFSLLASDLGQNPQKIVCRSQAHAYALIKLHNAPREELVGRVVNAINQPGFDTLFKIAEAAP